MSLLKNYQENEGYLTKTEKLCFETLLKNIDADTHVTIQGIADATSVSTTTIFRMIKNLGYASFNEFKYDLLYSKRDKLSNGEMQDDTLCVIEEKLKETIGLLREENIDKIVDKIISAKKVMVCGSGMNNYIGGILEVKLTLCNIDAKYREDSWLMYLESSNLTKDDVVIILSKTGETKVLIDIVKNIKINGVSIIYIGEVGHSKIGELADYKLSVAKVEEEGIDMDSRLQLHLAINYLTKKITDKITDKMQLQK